MTFIRIGIPPQEDNPRISKCEDWGGNFYDSGKCFTY